MRRLRVYCSDQAHSSIDKAVITLGLGTRSLRKIAVNERFEMRADALGDAIDEDIDNGFVPICVIPTIGTTSSSSASRPWRMHTRAAVLVECLSVLVNASWTMR